MFVFVTKDPEWGAYYVQCRYKDWAGEFEKKAKHGTETEKETRKWEYEFLKRVESVRSMLISEFYGSMPRIPRCDFARLQAKRKPI